jgi:hypothetical protein
MGFSIDAKMLGNLRGQNERIFISPLIQEKSVKRAHMMKV